MSTYQFGKSRSLLPVSTLVDIRSADQAKRFREQAAEIRLLAVQSAELLEARQDLAAAHSEARRAEYELLSWDERMARAEAVRVSAWERYGYDPVECQERIDAATAERTRGHWVAQKRGVRRK